MSSTERNASGFWNNARNQVLNWGTPHIGREKRTTREVLGFCKRIEDPTQGFVFSNLRRPDPIYAAAELLWYLTGTPSSEMILAYAPSYKRFMNDGIAYGAYGPRIMPQWNSIWRLLRNKPETRQAVINIWRLAEDLDAAEKGYFKDIPCTISLQFILRDDLLNLIVTMRSNDVWLGMPYDVFCFTSLQRLMAADLGVGLGWYQHQAGSLHIYDKDFHRLTGTEMIKPQWGLNLAEMNKGVQTDITRALFWERMVRLARVEDPLDVGHMASDLLSSDGRQTILSNAVGLCALKWRPDLYDQLKVLCSPAMVMEPFYERPDQS